MEHTQLNHTDFLKLIENYKAIQKDISVLINQINGFIEKDIFINQTVENELRYLLYELNETQKKLFEVSKEITLSENLPEFTNIDELKNFVNNFIENVSSIKNQLQKFLLIVTDDEEINSSFNNHKEKLKILLKKLDSLTPPSEYEFFLMFVNYIESPNPKDLYSLGKVLTEKEFECLFNGHFYLKNDIQTDSSTRSTDSNAVADSTTQEQTQKINESHDELPVKLESPWLSEYKNVGEFSVKRFKSDLGDFDKKKGFIITKPMFLFVLVSIAKFKILKSGITFVDEEHKAEFEFYLSKAFDKGYLIKLIDPLTENAYFCLSDYGTNVFRKESSRETIKDYLRSNDKNVTYPGTLFSSSSIDTVDKKNEVLKILNLNMAASIVLEKYFGEFNNFSYDEEEEIQTLTAKLVKKNLTKQIIFTLDTRFATTSNAENTMVFFVSMDETLDFQSIDNKTFVGLLKVDVNTTYFEFMSLNDSIHSLSELLETFIEDNKDLETVSEKSNLENELSETTDHSSANEPKSHLDDKKDFSELHSTDLPQQAMEESVVQDTSNITMNEAIITTQPQDLVPNQAPTASNDIKEQWVDDNYHVDQPEELEKDADGINNNPIETRENHPKNDDERITINQRIHNNSIIASEELLKMPLEEKVKHLLQYVSNSDIFKPEKDTSLFISVAIDLLNKMYQNELTLNEDENEPLVSHYVQALAWMKSLSLVDIEGNPYKQIYLQVLHGLDSDFEKTKYNLTQIDELFTTENDGIFGIGSVFHLGSILRMLFHREVEKYDDSKSFLPYIKTFYENFDSIFLPDLKILFNLFKLLKDFNGKYPQKEKFSKNNLKAINGFFDSKNELLKIRSLILNNIQHWFKLNNPVTSEFIAFAFQKTNPISQIIKVIESSDVKNNHIIQDFINDFTITKNDVLQLNTPKVYDYVSDLFDEWERVVQRQHPAEPEKVKKKANTIFVEFFENLKEWLDLDVSSIQNESDVTYFNELKKLREEIIGEINEVRKILPELKNKLHRGCITILLLSFENKLLAKESIKHLHYDLLRSGFWRINSLGSPNLIDDHSDIEGDEIKLNFVGFDEWIKMLHHLVEPKKSFKEIKALILDANVENNPYLWNFGQLEDIEDFYHHYYNMPKDLTINYENDFQKQVLNFKKTYYAPTLDQIESALAEGRITENTRDILIEELDYFFNSELPQSHNFGVFKRFILTVRNRIEKETQALRNDVENILNSQITNNTQQLNGDKLTQFEQMVLQAKDFLSKGEINLAEDVIHHIETKQFDSFEKLIDNKNSFYLDFATSQLTKDILHTLKQKQERPTIGAPYEKLVSLGVIESENIDRLIENMVTASSVKVNPGRESAYATNKCQKLLKSMGFPVIKVNTNINLYVKSNDDNSRYKYIRFNAEMEPTTINRSNYSHPIPSFGTQIQEKSVFFYFDKIEVSELLDEIISLPVQNNIPIIIVNWHYSLEERRKLAMYFHSKPEKQKEFILIDWLLLLYLVPLGRNERLQTILGTCLPLTTKIQPFISSGGGGSYLPDEMFIGRTKELSEILDLNGKLFVYGGRQLGKTALLMRARSIFNEPDHLQRKNFAIYIDGKSVKNYDDFIKKLKDEFNRFQLLNETNFNDLQGFVSVLTKMYKKTWNSVLLLIDEVDLILGFFKDRFSDFEDLSHLVELRRSTMNNFKFVLAGVHDLCRTVKNRNTIFGQLGAPLVIKPLAPTDAVRLLSLPLSYFGFGLEVKAIQKILLNTLYYPGIIHSFGAEILNKLSNNYNLYFNDTNNPPYQLNESQLNRLITDIDLNQKINEKIEMTLRVDAYNYLVLAYAIGILYFDYKDQGLVVGQGFTASKILSTIKEYLDKNFEHLMHWEGITTDETQSFLDEMEEMGIITSSQYATNSPKLYRFRRRRFLDALGTSFDDLFYKLTEGFK